MPGNKKYNLIAENPQSTVVAEYAAVYRTAKSYQSEAELERAFIEQLESQAYEYLPTTAEADLVLNLRQQLEKLNDFTFADAERERFFTGEMVLSDTKTECFAWALIPNRFHLLRKYSLNDYRSLFLISPSHPK